METAITALIVIGVLILAVLGLSQSVMASQASMSNAFREMQDRALDRTRTNLTTDSAAVSQPGDLVQIALRNAGGARLYNFTQWDVLLQYTDVNNNTQLRWYAYNADWTSQIYQSLSPVTPESFEPGILNPGEIFVIQVNVSPAVKSNTNNLAIISTPNGVVTSAVFTH